MKMTVKSNISFIMVLTVIFAMGISCFAKTNTKIYADDIKTEAGETVSMPVYINDNEGLMGYKITVKYDSGLIPVSVTCGDSFNRGIFNDNIGVAQKGSFDVVWSNTTNITANGVVFTITFKVDENTSGRKNITFICSQDDTFNEKWEEVKLDCGSTTIQVGEDINTSQTLWEKIVEFIVFIFNYIIRIFK